MTIKTVGGKTIFEGYGHNKMYEVEILEIGTISANYSWARDRPADLLTWHRRLGHIGICHIL